ncbi:MAG: outer membrane lipoprotein-sorting protein [Gammaproteobacteria bacterium]|nr:outer membrane lipoprotein-sorting protein [Gammaproteobacteria bacterium]
MKIKTHALYTRLAALVLLAGLLPSSANATELTAREIMQKVQDRDTGDHGISDMEMILIDKKGHQRSRKIRRYSKYQGEDKQTSLFFLTPASVKNTAFLTYDYDDTEKDDDQWLYLPALRKSKRIASSDKSGSFMGSDFNYSDMTDKNLAAYTYKILKEAKVRGDKTWVIEAIPQTKKEIEESGYKKSIIFVRQDNFVGVRALHWVNKGKRMKYLDIKKLQQIDGIWTATEMSMTSKEGKSTLHKTILKFSNVHYNQKLNKTTFSLRGIEKGL